MSYATKDIRNVALLGHGSTGKTTLASIIAESTSAEFIKLNAVTSGVGEVREALKEYADLLGEES